jgi:hypothetical protein
MISLAIVFERLQPPEFDQARDWLHCEAEAGNTDAVVGLVLLLAQRLHPPDLDQARHWLEKAGKGGRGRRPRRHGEPRVHLEVGCLLGESDERIR